LKTRRVIVVCDFRYLNLRGEVVVRKKFSRAQLLHFTANRHVELSGVEACGGIF